MTATNESMADFGKTTARTVKVTELASFTK
jgi:hypothetical protein